MSHIGNLLREPRVDGLRARAEHVQRRTRDCFSLDLAQFWRTVLEEEVAEGDGWTEVRGCSHILSVVGEGGQTEC